MGKIHILGIEYWPLLFLLANIININNSYHSFPTYYVPTTT